MPGPISEIIVPLGSFVMSCQKRCPAVHSPSAHRSVPACEQAACISRRHASTRRGGPPAAAAHRTLKAHVLCILQSGNTPGEWQWQCQRRVRHSTRHAHVCAYVCVCGGGELHSGEACTASCRADTPSAAPCPAPPPRLTAKQHAACLAEPGALQDHGQRARSRERHAPVPHALQPCSASGQGQGQGQVRTPSGSFRALTATRWPAACLPARTRVQ